MNKPNILQGLQNVEREEGALSRRPEYPALLCQRVRGSPDTTLMDSVLDIGSGQRRTQKPHALSDGSEVGVVTAIS